ncbi:MAG TPA: dihydrolipoyllysine-residue acetyltransferase [Burkholderiales bacterium]|nr:dihydrolipoyllysine-residue acetyltransferase [Burkholderiales bacterium]
MSQVLVPDIGDFKEVEVIEVLVKPGDAVAKEQSLITLESDKATMEIPSPAAGVVKELKIKTGDKVSKGSPILVLDEKKGDEKKPQVEKTERPQPQAQVQSGNGQSQTVSVPDIGDFKEVEVIEVLVKPGDSVTKEQSLITLESDKATMEIPSPAAGVVKELKVKVGDKVSKDSPILLLTGGDARAQAAPVPTPAPRKAEPKAARAEAAVPPPVTDPTTRPVPREPREETATKPHASPSVRKFARELGVDLRGVQGSGPKGRIVHSDVQGFVKQALSKAPMPAAKGGGALPFELPAWPEVDFAKFGPVEKVPLSRIQKLSGPYLHRNWISIPHVTQFDEADITDLEAFRKSQTTETEKKGFKLTMLAFMIKACVTALKAFPQFNASLERGGEGVVIKKYYHIGVAVDTPEGLVVPVVRDADRKGVFDLAKELGEISKMARDKKLKAGDLQGGTFSISSLGGIGGTYFTPIINAPEVAILGVSRSVMKPVWTNGEFKARLILPLSLSYDHRVIDGATAARFTTYLVSVLSDIRKSLL